ncbi:hypothetical protein CHS0354_036548 [Potamilus streckersoni]|uniref:Uncharacterized protein n=1 Tax=Potamilus streckersoni TaxID=2493646 RepID=A0AAE0SXV6_9BIVA|nr:hypothetical protein CHS0354_036548 [Potamilus streckersoni]
MEAQWFSDYGVQNQTSNGDKRTSSKIQVPAPIQKNLRQRIIEVNFSGLTLEDPFTKLEAKNATKFLVQPNKIEHGKIWEFSHNTKQKECQNSPNQPLKTTATCYTAVAMKGMQNENKENKIQRIPEPEEENQSKSDEMIAPSPSETISSQESDGKKKGKADQLRNRKQN